MFNPNRLHAILEASSATRNGAARANKQYGGRDINLVALDRRRNDAAPNGGRP